MRAIFALITYYIRKLFLSHVHGRKRVTAVLVVFLFLCGARFSKRQAQPRGVGDVDTQLLTKYRTLDDGEEKPNLVLGCNKGLKIETLNVFLRSLRQSGSKAEFITFVDDPLPELVELLQEFGGSYIPYNSTLYDHIHPASHRFILYNKFLNENASKYNMIFLTDTRDVVFQRCPFATYGEYSAPAVWAQGDRLAVFQEDKSWSIGRCGWNSRWIRECYPPPVLKRYSVERILCSGTTMGTAPAIVKYVQAIVDTLERTKCFENGQDQGFHNVITRDGTLGTTAVEVFSNEEGFVTTLGFVKDTVVRWDRFGRMINAKRQVYAVLHQVDRKKYLMDQFAEQYPFGWDQRRAPLSAH